MSERIERSSIGQLVISALIVLLLLAELGTHLPGSAVERSVSESSNQIIRVLASEQAWGVFAPDPRPTSLQLYARITFEDGKTAIWHLPKGNRVVGNLRYYRWRKWLERARSDSYSDIWDPTARWIATLYDDGPSPVARVELVRRFHDNVVVGPQPPWQEFVYYTLDVGAEDR